MSFQDFALLFAVATPVVVLVAMNAYLWFNGDETLLFPSLKAYPSIDTAPRAIDETPAETGAAAVHTAANEEEERMAA